jgi:hypothetical protein
MLLNQRCTSPEIIERKRRNGNTGADIPETPDISETLEIPEVLEVEIPEMRSPHQRQEELANRILAIREGRNTKNEIVQ